MLASIALFSFLEIVAPGVKLSDPVRIADFTYGAVRETYARTDVKVNDGYRVVTTTDSQQISTDVDANGTPDLGSRTFGPVTGTSGYRQCGATECLNISFEGTHAYGVMTDAGGNLLGDRFPLPDFPRDPLSISSVVPDPAGFAYVRIDRGHFVPARAVRIDLSGNVVYDVALRTFEPVLRWAGHYVEIGTMCALGACDLVADDISATGELGPVRVLYANAAPHGMLVLRTVPVRVALITQTVTMLSLDAPISTATVESTWDVPVGFGVIDLVPNQSLPSTQPVILAVLGSDGAVYTTLYGSNVPPRLLSYGARPQRPLAIARSDSSYLVVWSEYDASENTEFVVAARRAADGLPLFGKKYVLGRDSAVYGATAAAIGPDVLVCWTGAVLNASQTTDCAIVHPDFSFDRVSLGDGAPKPIAALPDAWIVGRMNANGIAVNRVTTGGFVYPPVTFDYLGNGGLAGVASDGQNVMVVTALVTYVMTPDLTIVRSVPHESNPASAVAFSGGSYLLAGGSHVLYRMNAAGEITSARQYFLSGALLTAVRHGWLDCWPSTSCTRVVPDDPPLPAAYFPVPGVSAIATQADDRVGMVTSDGNAIYLREVEFYDPPRRRAVQH